MNVKEYYQLRNRGNNYSNQEGLQDAYELQLEMLEIECETIFAKATPYCTYSCEERYKCEHWWELRRLKSALSTSSIEYIESHKDMYPAFDWLDPKTIRTIKNIHNRIAVLKMRKKQLEDLEHINKLLVDYDEVIIMQHNRYGYLI